MLSLAALADQLDELRRLQAASKSNTDRQMLWTQRLADTEKLIIEAMDLEASAGRAPDDAPLQRRAMVRATQAKLAMDQVRKGTRSFRENYDDAHGGTVEQKRAGWNEAYRERVRQKEGREPTTYAKPSRMTPEEREKHEAERERRKYEAKKLKRAQARQAAGKQVEPDPDVTKHPLWSKF